MKYTPVIGLEVHVELKTLSKMFCGCSADYFGKKPNTHTCPVCLGMPGALPVPNRKAIEWCVMIGLALNCEIPSFSKFDRKNYFYPDLAKGYQISQYDQPFCIAGSITLSNGKKIGITRAHMEEDTAKLTHVKIDGENVSLIDFNRSGVPLVEIVTEPDFESAEEVMEYLKRLQQIVRHLGVSNADMEEGDMRLEPNISLRKEGIKELPKYKVEVKNINSFKFVGKAIEYEIKRQAEILEKGDTPKQETRGWNEAKNVTLSQRSKEEAKDYRYFPEPDIPPIRWSKEEIEQLRENMPVLADKKVERYQTEYDLTKDQAVTIINSEELEKIFEDLIRQRELVKSGEEKPEFKVLANWIINRKKDIENQTTAQIFHSIQSHLVLVTISNEEMKKLAQEAIEENPKAVSDFKAGKETVIQVLIGAVMRKTAGKADASKVKGILKALLTP